MRKKLLSLALALVMCLGLTVPAFAADSDFTIEDGFLTEYNGSGGDVTIPDGVTDIGDYAFTGCTGLTSVAIPDSVTYIGDYAFGGCTGLTSVTIPDGVVYIGYEAFAGCTGLTSVAIPDGVTSIGEGAFASCTGLTSIMVSSGNRQYTSIDGVLFSADKSVLVCYPAGKQGSYTIPDGVTYIEREAFFNCIGLTSVTIPGSVTYIGRFVFSGCTGLTSVTIPGSVTGIGAYAFQGCEGLTGVTIPNSVTEIGKSAFAYCAGLTSVTIPDGVTSIEESAFSNCTGLTSVTIPGSVTSIGEMAFCKCTSLTSVTIPSSVTSIGEMAFDDCTGLTDVYYGGSESQWEAIKIVYGNGPLKDAAIHYNSTMPQQPAESTVGGFSDVKTGAWYAEPVLWAVENKITVGTSDTTFSPDVNCTQSQILTFLWRAKGEPAPAGAVSGDEWYAEAAQWAAEQGLTDGFSAEAPCTRAMVVTYLWELAGSPKAASSSSFTDVPDTLADAVSWAAEQDITTGTSATTFSPDVTCTRGQIVTFLYRAFAK